MRSSYRWKHVFIFVVLSVLASVVLCGSSVVAFTTTAQQSQPVAPPFIPVFTWNYQCPLPSAQESILAEYSFSDLGRWAYKDNLGHNTWQALKSLNPTQQTYLYELAAGTYSTQDTGSVEWANSINRWNNARGLPMGNLNTQNPDLFALDAHGNRIDDSYGAWLLDFGTQKYVDYWVAAATADITDQAWKADGIFVDGPWLEVEYGLSSTRPSMPQKQHGQPDPSISWRTYRPPSMLRE